MTGSTVRLGDLTATSSPADYEAVMADPDNVKQLVTENKLGDFVKNYADSKMKALPANFNQIVQEQAQIVLQQMLKDNGQETNRLNLSPDTPESETSAYKARNLYNPEALGASLDGKFKNTADFLQTIWHRADVEDTQVRERRNLVRNAFGSEVPSEGGFLIPERLRSELLRVALETSIVRPRARVIPMDSLRVPFPTIDSTSNQNSVYGGITGFWTEESATLQDSEAKFGRIVLDAKKLTAYTEVPTELMTDSIVSMEAFINEMFPEALGFFEDVAFLTGSGVGEPLGTLNGAAAVAVTRAGATAIDWIDVVKMYQRMLPGSLNRAVWVASIDTFAQLATMEVSAGSPAVWINHQLSEGPPMTLLGRPVLFTEKVPALGTLGDFSFIDFGYYLLGDRQAMSARSSEDYKFRNDQTAFRFIERVDGRPWLQSAITPHNGGDTLSPIVKLAA
jgi:HK97 family phage major capsid protein